MLSTNFSISGNDSEQMVEYHITSKPKFIQFSNKKKIIFFLLFFKLKCEMFNK